MLIGVEPWARGRGVGRGLMEHAEAALFGESDDVFVLVPDGDHTALAFCRRLGYAYAEVGAIPDYVVQGVTELVFRKHHA
jgi:ribosomal protein S18 acetylase RimI-like enzyme